jgi:hypothetical protein
MGLVRKVTKQAEETPGADPPGPPRQDSIVTAIATNKMVEVQIAAMSQIAAGICGTDQVIAVAASSGSCNANPILPLSLLVTLPGQSPISMSPTLVIPAGQSVDLAMGVVMPVAVSTANPGAGTINRSALS